MRILGIETSADDTGVAFIEAEGTFGASFRFSLLANEIASQEHAEYGGIYPNLAKNEHKKNLPLLLEKATAVHGRPDIIAVTVGPGLEPCLWTGITFAQKLATDWNVPVVAVNHLEGHILMSMVHFNDSPHPDTLLLGKVSGFEKFEFPVLALLISGGNTQLVLSKEPLRYEVVGKTRDDAVGEAFDKVARMMGLPYPGGPEVSRLAEQARKISKSDIHNYGSPTSIRLPRPMINEDNFDFSFSGLKTAVLRILEANAPASDVLKKKLAREFEDAAADVLVAKTVRAVEQFGVSTVVGGGGVSANTFIRLRLAEALAEAGSKFFVCPPELSTDNAAMIALAGYFHAQNRDFARPDTLVAKGNLRLETL